MHSNVRCVHNVPRRGVKTRSDAHTHTTANWCHEYGSTSWELLYQADVRRRLDLMERLRRRLSQEEEAGRPWDAAWRHACNEVKFWRREYLLVITKTARARHDQWGSAGCFASSRQNREACHRGDRMRTSHNVKERNFTTNCAGKTVCTEFQAGTCDPTLQGGWYSRGGEHTRECPDPSHGAGVAASLSPTTTSAHADLFTSKLFPRARALPTVRVRETPG